MTKINIYDAEYRRINELCENLRITHADLIESMVDIIEQAASVTDFSEYEQEGA